MSYEGWEEDARVALAELSHEIDCDVCALGLLAEGDRALKWRLASGNANERFLSIVERLGGGLSGTVLKVGRAMSLQLSDLLAERRIHEYPIMLAEGLRSAYAAPVFIGTDVVGVLLAGDRRRRMYRPEDRAAALGAAVKIGALLMRGSNRDVAPSANMVE